MFNWKRYVGWKTERLLPGTLRTSSEAKADGGEDAKGNSRREGVAGSIPLQLRRRASEDSSKNSRAALSPLTDDCRPAHTLPPLESSQARLPKADGDSYREGLVAGQPCQAFRSMPQIDAPGSHGSKQGAWQKQLLLGNLFVPPRNTTASPALPGGHVPRRAMRGAQGQNVITVHPLPSCVSKGGFILVIFDTRCHATALTRKIQNHQKFCTYTSLW